MTEARKRCCLMCNLAVSMLCRKSVVLGLSKTCRR